MLKSCCVPICNSLIHAKGYCLKHYAQYRKHGKIIKSIRHEFNEVIDKKTHYELILTNAKGEETGRAKIDKEDLDKVRTIGRWCLDKNGYIMRSSPTIILHRFIMDAREGEYVDHKKTGKLHRLDNRKSNLRVCTFTENMINRPKQSNNTSGYKGVFWVKSSQKWLAKLGHKGKYISLGTFDSALEASKAYNKAAKTLQGKFYNKE